MKEGVSFVVPVHNGAACIREALTAILSQADGRPMEVVVVDDRSRDGSSELLGQLSQSLPIRVVPGEGRGAAAAINTGLRAARFPIICQVDQDVVLKPGWMRHLVDCLEDPAVAAVQGYYETDPAATVGARATSLDLEQRYAAIQGPDTEQVCTGNAAYRAAALRDVGLFDETLGYGYDNDMSYRLHAAGYRLLFCREARSVHRWREGLTGYLIQQYGFGYGRIDLVARHPNRWSGDSVSPSAMMAHPLLMSLALTSLIAGLIVAAAGGASWLFTMGGAALIAALMLERLAAGASAAHRFHDRAAFLFPIFHLFRDLVWVLAIGTWMARRLAGHPARPHHSMRARPTPEPAIAWRLRRDAGIASRAGFESRQD